MSPALSFPYAHFHDIVCGAWTLLANTISVIIVAILVVALCYRAATQSLPNLTVTDIIVVKVLIVGDPYT